MKKTVIVLVAVIILLAANGLIIQREKTLSSGTTVLLKLAPVDPRSLIQGDYMVLRYEVEAEADKSLGDQAPGKGQLVLGLDEHGVGHLRRLHRDESLAEDELLLTYRLRGQPRLGAESFFFQEGHAEFYQSATYGELKVAPSGESVLVGLRDESYNLLGPDVVPAEQPVTE